MFHAPDVLTAKCRIHKLQTTLKITVSCLDANPRIHVALKITVGSCSTHQHLLKQQLAPWSVASEVLTSDPSCVKFLGPNNATTKGKTQLQRSLQGKKMQNLVMLSLVLITVYTQDTGYGGEQLKMLNSARPSDTT